MRPAFHLLLTLCLVPATAGSAASFSSKQESSISPIVLGQLAQDPAGTEYNVLVHFESRNASKSELSSLAASAHTLYERYQTVGTRLRSSAVPVPPVPQTGRIIRRFWIANVVEMRLDRDGLLELAKHDGVEMIYPNVTIELLEPTSSVDAVATSAGAAANLQTVGARALWARGLTGKGRLVASIDTGVEGIHPALRDRWRGVHGDTSASWFDPLGSRSPDDNSGHGTHVMGIMVGRHGADTVGLAPDAEWITAAVVDRGRSLSATFADILAALEWVVDPDRNPATMEDVPDVVCNSWGVSQHIINPCDDLFFEAIDNVEAMGIVCIFAAGNEGPNAMSIRNPADRGTSPTASFSVGAVDAGDPNLPVPSFSSRGPSACDGSAAKPEMVAPGVAIRSTYKGQSYRVMNGTSMSAPHVAAGVALLKQYNPELTPEDIKTALLSTARDIGEAGEDNASGRGMIDLEAAVQSLPSTIYPQISTGELSLDPLGDGVPVSGERVELIVPITIEAADAQGITLHLSSLTDDAVVLSDAFYAGTIWAGTRFDNSDAPFIFELRDGARCGDSARFEIRMSGDARLAWWRDTIAVVIGLPRSVSLATATEGPVAFTSANFGQLGLGERSFLDAGGTGWRTSLDISNLLYEGALMLSSSDGGWSDASRRENGVMQFDFVPQPAINSKSISYDDSRSHTPVGLVVDQPAPRIVSGDGYDIVIVTWMIRNQRGSTVPGFQAGWLLDIDLPAALYVDELAVRDEFSGGFYHMSTSLGFVAGVAPLSGAFGSLSFLENAGWSKYAPLLTEKREAFVGSSGAPEGAGDYFTIATTSALDLPAGDSVTFALAFISARSPALFADASDEAYHFWLAMADSDQGQGGLLPPTDYSLGQNYPNPFNSGTTIPIAVAGNGAGNVRLELFDLLGRRVRVLMSAPLPPGSHTFFWDGADDYGRVVASGVYFSRLIVPGQPPLVRQMVHLK